MVSSNVEWQVEEGIGEERAICIADGDVIAARLRWPSELETGTIAEAKLITRRAGSSRGTAQFADGAIALISKIPRDASEGAALICEVTRPALLEQGRGKLAQVRPSSETKRPAPSLAEQFMTKGDAVRTVRTFGSAWDDIISDALTGVINFPGGSLTLSPTPAMTLVDVDGDWNPSELALTAVPAIAAALRTLDIGGNIGIDFPTLQSKAERNAVNEALGVELADWPHERTGMNGFGFVQIIARLARPSLLHRAQFQRADMAARLLLRRAEHLEGTGTAIELTAHPAVLAKITDGWREELVRRTGRKVVDRADPALAPEAPHAQFITL